jgi:prefoldin subunit 5
MKIEITPQELGECLATVQTQLESIRVSQSQILEAFNRFNQSQQDLQDRLKSQAYSVNKTLGPI